MAIGFAAVYSPPTKIPSSRRSSSTPARIAGQRRNEQCRDTEAGDGDQGRAAPAEPITEMTEDHRANWAADQGDGKDSVEECRLRGAAQVRRQEIAQRRS